VWTTTGRCLAFDPQLLDEDVALGLRAGLEADLAERHRVPGGEHLVLIQRFKLYKHACNRGTGI
jgi:hypothetical protein